MGYEQPSSEVSLRYKLHEKIGKLRALIARPGTKHEGDCARAKLSAIESQLQIVDEAFADTQSCSVEPAISERITHLPQDIVFGPGDRDRLVAQAEERLPARARELLDGASLTRGQREVILLVYWQDMTEEDVAAVLERDRRRVYKTKAAALEKIKRFVGNEVRV